MIKYCRNCGKGLTTPTDTKCPHCGSNPVKSTSYCRFCGSQTNAGDAVCAHCGVAVRPISHAERMLLNAHPRLVKSGKIVNLTLVVILVSAYVIFTLPKSVTKPIKAAAEEVVETTTGYTALPLQYIVASPQSIPTPSTVGEVYVASAFDVNSTRQIRVFAIFKNMDSNNDTRATRMEEVTENCTFTTNDSGIVEISPEGIVRALGYGIGSITATYTAAPGSSNRTTAANGKIPVTFSVNVTVNVGRRGPEIIGATYT